MQSTKGSVLVLLAISLAVLVLFIALAVDTAVLGTSHQKQARTAELGALAAVEAFLATTGDNTVRLAAARTRAEQVVGLSFNNFISQNEIQQASSGQVGDLVSGAGERGVLIPGQYYFSEPVETCALFNPALNNPAVGDQACPCPGGQWKGECFRPHTGSAEWDGVGTDDRPISAFQMDLYTAAGNPVKTVFSQAGGARSDFDLFSTAIATVTPRHVVFLIDLSGSMMNQTHRLASGGNFSSPPYAPVAFKVSSCPFSNSTATVGTVTCNYPGETSTNKVTGFAAGVTWRGYPGIYAGMPICRDLSANVSKYFHYRDDYQCFEVDDGNPLSPLESFLVENGYFTDGASARTRIDSNNIEYRGPEPLSTVLSGVNETLRALSVLSVPGDLVTFIAHDHDVSSFVPRNIGPVSPGDANFQTLLRLTDHDGLDATTRDDVDGLTKAIIDERIQGQLFPRPGAYTDLSEAILRAYTVLSQSPGSEIADNQIIVFGDGLGNCPHSQGTTVGTANPITYPDPSNEIFLISPTTGEINFVRPTKDCNDSTDPAIPSQSSFAASYSCASGNIYENSPNCKNALNAYNSYIQGYSYYKSTTEVRAMISGEGRPLLPSTSATQFNPLVKNGFKFHAFLFGRHIQPHTLLIKGSNGCMTEGEAREEGISYADSGSITDSSISHSPYGADESKPFVKPNHDFQANLVSPTKGRFFPIRVACQVGDLNGIPATGADLVTASNCSEGFGLKRLDTYCNSQTSYNVGDVIRNDIPGILSKGRLICDPYCRDENTQVDLGIGSLFQDNPIISVEAPNKALTSSTN